MFRLPKRKPKRSPSHKSSSRGLRFESLEHRRLLAGIVNLDTAASPGDLIIEGDNSNNQVLVRSGIGAGQFIVEGKSGTLLRLDGGLQTFSQLTINGIVDDLFVNLRGGADTFELGTAAGSRTTVVDDVNITNDDDDVNIIRNADIGGDLVVDRIGGGASSELTILDTIVRGNVSVDNDGPGGFFDGDSKTTITTSEIEGTLTIENAEGDDIIVIDRSSIGAALFVRPPGPPLPTIPVVSITNGNGSSFTTITSKNDPATTTPLPSGTLGRPTVFGGINIVNGDPVPPGVVVAPPAAGGAAPTGLLTTVDIVIVNNADILGHLNVFNFDGHSEVIVVDSKLGTDTKSIADGGYGGPVTVQNGVGFDILSVQRSEAQYGLFVNNGTGTWGSHTLISDSEIGAAVTTGAGLSFLGDDGSDVFNVNDAAGRTIIGGEMVLSLNGGNDHVSIIGVNAATPLSIRSLMISGNAGDDTVYLQNTRVISMASIELHAGVDTLEIRGGVVLPNSLTGTLLLDGGVGADFYTIPAGIPFVNFEIQIP